MPIPPIRRSVAHARLAKAVQAGRPDEVVEQLRAEYHACAARDRILDMVPRVAPEYRRELASLLLPEGDADAA